MLRSLTSTTPAVRARVLLATASAGGTIAAARCLAANGFDVRVLSSELFAAAGWSRSVTRRHRAPSELDSGSFLSKLLAIGKAEPGQILLPTSDQTTWLYAANLDLLGQYYQLYMPDISVIRRILDKKLLGEAADKAGFATLPSWDPQDSDELKTLAPVLPYPILLKPRTHVQRVASDRGAVVHCPKELLQQCELFAAPKRARSPEALPFPDAARPILQQFVAVGSDGVQSITGFIDRDGGSFVTRRSRKVFQRSWPVGVGVCYESLPHDVSLSRSVHAICRELGHFGMFEVEFLPFDGGWAVIDFNPRLYNQVGLDISRGLPLPTLACLAAAGDALGLTTAVARAQSAIDNATTVFYDSFTLHAMLGAMYVTSRLSGNEFARWRAWEKQNSDRSVDVASDRNDPMPGVIHALSETCLGMKGVWRFFKSTPRVRSA